ncbi:MFS transporter [Nocardioides sp. C4-1]|uniref:MFS transporter n=1 Tax=Nocardioides sp. C4-1 TaxID=3151851 RepID=UPI0032657AB6
MRSWQRVAFAMFTVGWGANQFTPILIAYRDELDMSVQTRAFLFGVYAAGLVPALLVGGAASDRWGRRAVVLPFVALSPLASVLLVLEHDSTTGLAVARLLAGACSGVVFSAATAWVAEVSDSGSGPRRAAIALSAGFGAGPLAAGLTAQWAPRPLETPYLPHVVIGALAIVLLWPVGGPRPDRVVPRSLLHLPAVTRGRRFLGVVAPSAPWVFGCAALSIAYLPGELEGEQPGALAFAGVLAGVTLGCGVLVQGAARRLDERRPLLAGQVGLVVALGGGSIGVLALATDVRWFVLLGAPLLGAGYGCVLVSGLRETERRADPAERGATVAVFYAITYLGFALPYVLGAIGGDIPALLVALAVMALSLATVSVAGRPRATQ